MKKFILLIMFLLLSFPIFVKASDLTIMPIDYVNGDAALLESNGEYLLIDVGLGEDNTVLDFLDSKGITKFDLYLSHYDGDHFGSSSTNQVTVNEQAKTINLLHYIMSLNGTKYTIENLYIPAVFKRDSSEEYSTDETSLYNRHDYFVKAASLYDINCIELQTGKSFKFGNTTGEVLYLNTDPTVYSVLNNSSLVTMFTNGNVKFLTAGDIEEYIENKILENGIDVSADIYKLSHHGGYTTNHKSNTPAFLSKVSPKYTYAQFRYTIEGFSNLILGNGYYYVDEINKIKLSDISNVYSNWNSQNNSSHQNAKFVIEDDEITPIIENLTEYGRSVTINYVDKDTNEALKTQKYNFSLYSYVTDQGVNQNQYHLYDYKKTFKGYTLDSGEDEIITNGDVIENLTYNVYYSKNSYTLTIKHIDEEGNVLENEVITYKYKTEYSIPKNEELLKEYDLIEQPSNSSGVIEQDEVVIYRYRKKQEVSGGGIENPDTGIYFGYGILAVLILVSIILYLLIRKKSLFARHD